MKILFLSDDFPPNSFGGAGVVAYNLAKGLQKRGHELFVITTVRKKTKEEKIKFEGLNIFKIYASYHERWRSWLGLYNPQTVGKVEKIIKEIKPEIIHAHNIHSYLSYRCLKIAKKYSKAVFLTTHDLMLFHYGKLIPKTDNYIKKIAIKDQVREANKTYNPFRNSLIRNYLKYVDKIFAVSNSLKNLLEVNGIRNTEVVYNGIDVGNWCVDNAKIEEFKNKYNLGGKKVIIFSARLIEAKGGDQLIHSLSLVNKEFQEFILLVVGKEWAYTQKLKKIAEKLNIGGKIVFTDFLKEGDLKTAYNVADLSVFPSLCFETFGMSNLEAMACKKPVVSSYFGGPKEVVIDGETGYLVNPNNVDLMADKIIDLLKNPQKAKQFGEAGYKRVGEFFSLEKQADEILKRYIKYV